MDLLRHEQRLDYWPASNPLTFVGGLVEVLVSAFDEVDRAQEAMRLESDAVGFAD